MTKADVVTSISTKTGIDKVVVEDIIESFMRTVRNSLTEGKNIYLRGFGSFIVKRRASTVARDIKKNKTIIVPERHVPAFKPAKSFVGRVKKSKVENGKTV